MRPADRPRIEIIATPQDQILDWVSLGGVLMVVAMLATWWSKIPERVPTHFGVSGAPDGWGTRGSLLLFVIMPVVIHFGLTALARVPWIYNYPKAVTEENYQELYRLGRAMVLWLRTEEVWLMSLLGLQMMRVALHQASNVGPVLPLGFVGLILATVLYFVVQMSRAGQSR